MKLEEYEKEYAINVAVQVFNITEEKYESISLEDWLTNVDNRKKRMNVLAEKFKEIENKLALEEWMRKYKKMILKLEQCNCKKCQKELKRLEKLNGII
jgi:acyl carrier protein phosphodiesterase